LTAILGYAQVLQWQAGISERQASGLHAIDQAGQHLLGLIDEMLDLARIEAGRLELHLVALDLARFLEGIDNIIRVRVEHGEVKYVSKAVDLPCAVMADERRLRQVLLNLLGNAKKFTEKVTITLEARRLPSAAGGPVNLRFSVSDTGIGIEPQDLPLLFQPFQQVGDPERRRGGTGLGLAICRQLVEGMGGQIQVDSRPGHGSVFWFDLSLMEAEASAAKTDPVIVGYEGGRKTILVVDDTEENRKVLVHTLGLIGFSTHEATNGAEGIEAARANQPDLILMDHLMPVMGGIEATRRLRQMDGLGGVPIIALSANVTVESRNEALAAGASAVLPKPYRVQQLLAVIARQLSIQLIYR
jgi:CheY-like chemotaxis protein